MGIDIPGFNEHLAASLFRASVYLVTGGPELSKSESTYEPLLVTLRSHSPEAEAALADFSAAQLTTFVKDVRSGHTHMLPGMRAACGTLLDRQAAKAAAKAAAEAKAAKKAAEAPAKAAEAEAAKKAKKAAEAVRLAAKKRVKPAAGFGTAPKPI